MQTMPISGLALWRGVGTTLIVALSLVACTQEDSPPHERLMSEGSTQRGERIYLAQCTACHNRDPAKEGTLGPAVKGASQELLTARLLHASYPPDHRPKRDTALMPVLPHLASEIANLAAFLQASTAPDPEEIN